MATARRSYDDAVVMVAQYLRGFIGPLAVKSLVGDRRGIGENGKVIVTGCLGAKGDVVREAHPKVLGRIRPACVAK